MNPKMNDPWSLRTPATSGLTRAFLIFIFVVLDVAGARAQQPTYEQPAAYQAPSPPEALLPGIEILATPYLWFPWISVGL
ncbi:MAG: hypothetical protein AB7H71_01170, partial [Alphaproteobacteria bacterium]